MTVLAKAAGPSGYHHLTASGIGLVKYILTGSTSLFLFLAMSKASTAKAVQPSKAFLHFQLFHNLLVWIQKLSEGLNACLQDLMQWLQNNIHVVGSFALSIQIYQSTIERHKKKSISSRGMVSSHDLISWRNMSLQRTEILTATHH